MKVYGICFTKNGFEILKKLKDLLNNKNSDYNKQNNFYLSERIYDEIFLNEDFLDKENDQVAIKSDFYRANLRAFTEEAWKKADVILYVGATGIAVRSIAKYIDKKDKDPAVIVIDEQGRYVIPLLSGHIGGANDLSLYLAQKLQSQPIITTATDINKKLAIDSWARDKGYAIHDTGQIAKVTSAILEDREVLIFASESDCKELKNRGNILCFTLKSLDCKDVTAERERFQDSLAEYLQDISGKIETANGPTVVISPYHLGELEEKVLHLIPKTFCIGVGSRKDADPQKMADLYFSTLEQYGISPSAVISVNSIDIKKDESAILELEQFLTKDRWTAKKNRYSPINFFHADELRNADELTGYRFMPSEFVKSVTGVDNVCERAAVLGVALYKKQQGQKTDRDIQLLVTKTKGDSVTIAIAKLG